MTVALAETPPAVEQRDGWADYRVAGGELPMNARYLRMGRENPAGIQRLLERMQADEHSERRPAIAEEKKKAKKAAGKQTMMEMDE